MDLILAFGENLSELMFDNHLTAETLSKAIIIDRSEIYRFLRKESLPSLKNLIIIADYFKCSTDYLLGLSAENENALPKSAPPFAEQFKKILSSKKLTRYKLLQEIHFGQQSVDDWFHGKRMPTVENAITLANYFKCSLDYLLGRE